ncbi:phosphopentomutase [Lentilactobacillus senioris]|uniref:phosphopentomutase n=1 Tax=Lentilactobacillus senioris TaxID=931534 RepID=UPI00227E4232|nr:phosphopentomutase [Lentilactobacillus senioris]MCY9807348.1 phosphopentomutase [Lentilactobacillus senioris]
MNFKRVIILDIPSLGIGEASDANRFQSVGADTLGHVLTAINRSVALPNFTDLGLGNIRWANPFEVIAQTSHPRGFFSQVHMASNSQSEFAGLREMFDFQGTDRVETLFGTLKTTQLRNTRVSLLAPYTSYLANQRGVEDKLAIASDQQAFNALRERIELDIPGVIYTRLVDCATAAVDKDVTSYVAALEHIDRHLGRIMDDMFSSDILIVTASYAHDFLMDGPQPTREYLPLLAYTPQVTTGHSLGIRRTLGDIAISALDVFDLLPAKQPSARSFLGEMQ